MGPLRYSETAVRATVLELGRSGRRHLVGQGFEVHPPGGDLPPQIRGEHPFPLETEVERVEKLVPPRAGEGDGEGIVVDAGLGDVAVADSGHGSLFLLR